NIQIQCSAGCARNHRAGARNAAQTKRVARYTAGGEANIDAGREISPTSSPRRYAAAITAAGVRRIVVVASASLSAIPAGIPPPGSNWGQTGVRPGSDAGLTPV